jgi:hypothetical protein
MPAKSLSRWLYRLRTLLAQAGTRLALGDAAVLGNPRSAWNVEPIMRRAEYFLSVFLAMLVLAAVAAFTQVARHGGQTALSCRPGRAAAPVVLKGMSVYPRCPGGKRG